MNNNHYIPPEWEKTMKELMGDKWDELNPWQKTLEIVNLEEYRRQSSMAADSIIQQVFGDIL